LVNGTVTPIFNPEKKFKEYPIEIITPLSTDYIPLTRESRLDRHLCCFPLTQTEMDINWLRVSTSQRNRLEALAGIGLSGAGRIG
jgi:hypothetical protein